jgi:hypothetical protein
VIYAESAETRMRAAAAIAGARRRTECEPGVRFGSLEVFPP